MNTRTKNLFNYILPALGGLFVTYLYNVVDGIFVGQGVGYSALGAVNIAVPFITFSVAIASMFPMGACTIVAIRKGRGDKEGANKAFIAGLFTTIVISLLLMLIGMFFSKQIVYISGAQKLSFEMSEMASQYLFYYSAFSLPALLSNSLSVFVRNDGSPKLSFIGMCVGAVANIFLDWLFIFPLKMGVVGAAIASGIGQICSVIILITHFIFKKGDLKIKIIKCDLNLIRKICIRGIPEAITQFSIPVTALCYNIVLSNLMGDIGVSTFSVLSYIYSLANAILSGVAQGLQPLWGQCYGKKDNQELNWYTKSGFIINFILSIIIYSLLFIFDNSIINIFNKDSALVNEATKALPLFALSFIPMSLNLIFTSYLFSTKRTLASNVIAISRGVVIKSIAIFCIPLIFETNTIWLAPFFSELITLLLAFIITKTNKIIYK